MSEEIANLPKVLLVRLRWPVDAQMLVKVSLGREFMDRCLKLMLICSKIKRTMGGAGQVVIESHGQLYVTIESKTAIQRLVSKARVRERESFWVPAVHGQVQNLMRLLPHYLD